MYLTVDGFRIDKSVEALLDHIVETGNVPEMYNIEIDPDRPWYQKKNSFDNFYVRELYTENISWCLVNKSWTKDLANFLGDAKVVEVYAGKGLIAKQLKEFGVDITSYDNFSWNLNNKTFTKVYMKDAEEAIKSYENGTIDFVLMSWVPYEDKTCIKVLKILKENQPNCKIIYIGEPYGGCNACDEFFEMIDLEYMSELNQNFQHFDGMHDEIYVGSIK